MKQMGKKCVRNVLLTFLLISVFIVSGCSSGNLHQPKESLSNIQGNSQSKSFLEFKKTDGQKYITSPRKMFKNEPLISKNEKKYYNTEEYSYTPENEVKNPLKEPVSTFSIDVDTASYSNIRRYIMDLNMFPSKDAVRIEEMINYFDYNYSQPVGNNPFSINTEVAECLWNPKNKIALIGIHGKNIDRSELPPSNIVFLIDTSGSMKRVLPMLKRSLKILVDNLDKDDTISIVTYAGSSGVALEPTSADNKLQIKSVINKFEAGGPTAGGEGIQIAYKLAKESFIKNGNNRVVLATDGDFNIGISSEGALVRLIEEKRNDDIFLSVLGFGSGNYKDSKMEMLADKGNGNYFYIDNLMEAKKVLGTGFSSTLFAIAKDVKIQVEFNPAIVKSYRLIGYENRLLNVEDFEDDTKDAGELGVGHNVTALYEIELNNADSKKSGKRSELKYQEVVLKESAKTSDELMTIKLRYKLPDSDTSKLLESVIMNKNTSFDNASENFKFASAVAGYGMLLKDSKYKGSITYPEIIKIAKETKGTDEELYRAGFIKLVEKTELLKNTDS